MAKTEKQEATIFPIQVLGTVSPYPMVVTVIWKYKNNSFREQKHFCMTQQKQIIIQEDVGFKKEKL